MISHQKTEAWFRNNHHAISYADVVREREKKEYVVPKEESVMWLVTDKNRWENFICPIWVNFTGDVFPLRHADSRNDCVSPQLFEQECQQCFYFRFSFFSLSSQKRKEVGEENMWRQWISITYIYFEISYLFFSYLEICIVTSMMTLCLASMSKITYPQKLFRAMTYDSSTSLMLKSRKRLLSEQNQCCNDNGNVLYSTNKQGNYSNKHLFIADE